MAGVRADTDLQRSGSEDPEEAATELREATQGYDSVFIVRSLLLIFATQVPPLLIIAGQVPLTINLDVSAQTVSGLMILTLQVSMLSTRPQKRTRLGFFTAGLPIL